MATALAHKEEELSAMRLTNAAIEAQLRQTTASGEKKAAELVASTMRDKAGGLFRASTRPQTESASSYEHST
jgi:hypothetical protein